MKRPNNSRREDIIKAAKYHYRTGDLSTIGILRRVVAFHNGVPLTSLRNSDLLLVMVNDTGDEVFTNANRMKDFMNRCASSYSMNIFSSRMDGLDSTPQNDAMALLLTEYASRITHLLVTDLATPLPENCPNMKEFIENPFFD